MESLWLAAPDDWASFATNPMGSQEMYMYFDLCREVIGAGWFWCESEEGIEARRKVGSAVEQLKFFFAKRQRLLAERSFRRWFIAEFHHRV